MATNATEWWSLESFQVHNIRGVLTPFFRARDMAASTPITKQCFEDLAAARFIIRALYGGGSRNPPNTTHISSWMPPSRASTQAPPRPARTSAGRSSS